MKAWIFLSGVLLLTLSACGDSSDGTATEAVETASTGRPGELTSSPPETAEMPGEPAETNAIAPEQVEPTGEVPDPSTPTSGPETRGAIGVCRPLRERATPLYRGAGPLALLSVGEDAFVAGYAEQGGQELLVIQRVLSSGASRAVARGVLGTPPDHPRTAPPALAALSQAGQLRVAAVDARGHLQVAVVEGDAQAAPIGLHEVATGVDRRFAPSLHESASGSLLAWTMASTPMQVAYTADAGNPSPRVHRTAPAGGGGAQPHFLATRGRPTLTFIDPRAGISVLHQMVLRPDISPGEVTVVRPLMNLSQDPQVEVIEFAGELLVAYTAVGSLATSAVGLVNTGPDARLRPLVPGRGYGRVRVAAARRGDAALFALLAPSATTRGAPREIRLRAWRRGQLAEPQVIVPAARRPTHLALAHLENRTFLLAYVTDGRAKALTLRCTP